MKQVEPSAPPSEILCCSLIFVVRRKTSVFVNQRAKSKAMATLNLPKEDSEKDGIKSEEKAQNAQAESRRRSTFQFMVKKYLRSESIKKEDEEEMARQSEFLVMDDF